MIFSISPEVFYVENQKVQLDLSRILIEFLNNNFLWDTDNLFTIFFDDECSVFENSVTKNFVSTEVIMQIGELADTYLELGTYITKLHKFYLNNIVIGFDKGQVLPSNAIRLISDPSYVLLENSTNDWNFINGIIKNYCNHKKKKNIFDMIQDAVIKKNLLPYQVGGGGEFIKVINSHISGRYENIEKFKLIAIFDSDRDNSTEFNQKWYKLICFLKGQEFDKSQVENWHYGDSDKIKWHMLYKREIENYIPIKHLFEENPEWTDDIKEIINDLSPEQHDFFNFDKYLEEKKNESSLVFLNDDIKSLIIERCKHHLVSTETHTGILEQIDEPEFILQKIAKLI